VSAIRVILRKLRGDHRGATAIEYGLIAALIVIAMMGGLKAMGGGSAGLWGKIQQNVADSMS
jgi:pilus assembly protein Flp/PilA